MKLEVTRQQVEAALRPALWDLGNEVLYRLCREQPGHDQAGVIVAKFWLIGRAYAAAVERRRNPEEAGDAFYEHNLAQAIRGSDIDQWLSSLPQRVTNPWKDLRRVVKVHKKLVNLLFELTHLNKRSLASKYLHFHRPELFFLYDSRAVQATARFTPQIQETPTLDCREADPDYLAFCRRCQWLRDDIGRRFGVPLSPRQLDNLLLGQWAGEAAR